VSGNGSTDPGSDSVVEEVDRPVPSVPPVVFLVGRAVPGQPRATASDGRVACAVDDAGVIASDIGDAGGIDRSRTRRPRRSIQVGGSFGR